MKWTLFSPLAVCQISVGVIRFTVLSNNSSAFKNTINSNVSDSSGSVFEPHTLKFPKHKQRDGDDTFKTLADSYYQRSKQTRKEISAPYKQPTYPIEQQEDNQYFERQLSSR